jgi:DNA ligase-1
VRRLRPELVFELAFDGVEANGRRKAGLTLHAPRVLRWLRERDAAQAASLGALRELLD